MNENCECIGCRLRRHRKGTAAATLKAFFTAAPANADADSKSAKALQHLGAEVAQALIDLNINARDVAIGTTLAMWASYAAAEHGNRIPVVQLGQQL